MGDSVVSNFIPGGPDLKYRNDGNYIIIDHGDGTFAEYMHLERNSSLVRLGQRVTAGTPIGLSGMTGYATAPHLHFDVFHALDGQNRITLPMRFHTRLGDVYPNQGETY